MSLNISTITSPAQLLTAPNTATGGWFWTGVLIMIVIVILMLNIASGFEIAALLALFIALIVSIFLLYAGLIPFTIVEMIIAFLLLLGLYIYWSSTRENI